VAKLGVGLREVAEAHLVDLRLALQQMVADPDSLVQLDRDTLMARARQGDLVVLDVRPAEEYAAAHLPFARSLPLPELSQRLAELPPDLAIVAYCRGPFCLMSDEAVTLLRAQGYTAFKSRDGVSDWLAAGLPLERA
jgi:rhodanese-related sulfurtransferase